MMMSQSKSAFDELLYRYMASRVVLTEEETNLFTALVNYILEELKNGKNPVEAFIMLKKNKPELARKLEEADKKTLLGMLAVAISFNLSYANFLIAMKQVITKSIDLFLQNMGFKKK